MAHIHVQKKVLKSGEIREYRYPRPGKQEKCGRPASDVDCTALIKLLKTVELSTEDRALIRAITKNLENRPKKPAPAPKPAPKSEADPSPKEEAAEGIPAIAAT